MDHMSSLLDNYEFIDELPRSRRILRILGTSTRVSDIGFSWAHVLTYDSPIIKKDSSLREIPDPYELAHALGLATPESKVLLRFHIRRMRLRHRLVYGILSLISFSILALMIRFAPNFLSFQSMDPLTPTPISTVTPLPNNAISPFYDIAPWFPYEIITTVSGVVIAAMFIASLLALEFFLLIAFFRGLMRLSSFILDRRFAETLCIYSVVLLNVELARKDALNHPNRKETVVKRIRQLSRNTILLSLRYSSRGTTNQEWISQHFKHLQSYILERERWAVAPTDGTLSDLRRDFYKLAKMYIHGQYGNFTWDASNAIQQPSEATTLTWQQQMTGGLGRLMKIAIPAVIIVGLLVQPGLLASYGIEPNVVVLILLGWVLLSIDNLLNLGVASSAIAIAKGIKELK